MRYSDLTRPELLAHCIGLNGFDWDKLSTNRLEEIYMATQDGPPKYDPDYGDGKVCNCGHTYDRHFDSYEDMEPVGCKYCDDQSCPGFKYNEEKTVQHQEEMKEWAAKEVIRKEKAAKKLKEEELVQLATLKAKYESEITK